MKIRHLFFYQFIYFFYNYHPQVFLEADNGKPAQFKILPRYKVKSEGDLVSHNCKYSKQNVSSTYN